MKRNVFWSLFNLVIVIGCAKTSSDNIKTSGFYATYSVSGNNENAVTCSAHFQVSAGGTYIDLSSSDQVTCNGNVMSRSEFAGIVTYSTTLPFQINGTYTVVLSRTGEPPYSSSVTLPEPIVGTNVSNGSSLTKGSGLNLQWTPSSNANDDSLRIQFAVNESAQQSQCPNLQSLTDSSPENGFLGWASSETQSDLPGSCNMTIKWTRFRYGTMPSGLSGVIVGEQAKSTSVSFN